MNEPEIADILQAESPTLAGELINAYNNPNIDNELQAAANVTTYQVSFAFLIFRFIRTEPRKIKSLKKRKLVQKILCLQCVGANPGSIW